MLLDDFKTWVTERVAESQTEAEAAEAEAIATGVTNPRPKPLTIWSMAKDADVNGQCINRLMTGARQGLTVPYLERILHSQGYHLEIVEGLREPWEFESEHVLPRHRMEATA